MPSDDEARLRAAKRRQVALAISQAAGAQEEKPAAARIVDMARAFEEKAWREAGSHDAYEALLERRLQALRVVAHPLLEEAAVPAADNVQLPPEAVSEWIAQSNGGFKVAQETLLEFLAAEGLSHLCAPLEEQDATTHECFAELERGRTRLLQWLKLAGVERLSDRQAIANALGKAWRNRSKAAKPG